MARTIIIDNCAIVDVRRGVTCAGQCIVIDGDRISGIAGAGKVQDPAATIIDARGAFVLPGLIDMHVHICQDPDARPSSPTTRPIGATRTRLLASVNLETAISAGVTTIRDLGGGYGASFTAKADWRAGQLIGARPLVAGQMITAVGGHGTERGSTLGVAVRGPDDARAAVREAVANGADVIKLVTSGVVSRNELTFDELSAATAEAHDHGVPVASHANFGLRGIRNSIEAGCDSIEHCCVPDRSCLEQMAERRIAMCPTLTVMARIRERSDLYGGINSPLRAATDRAWEAHLENVQLADKLGVPIVAGTDAGMPAVGFADLSEELKWLAYAGLTRTRALQAATITAANVLRQNEFGVVANGKVADLIILDENPLVDLTALGRPRATIQAGCPIWTIL